jgi:hypothetical protein
MNSSFSGNKRAASFSAAQNARKNRRFERPRGATAQNHRRKTYLPYVPSSSRLPSSRAPSSNRSSFDYDPENESQISEREDCDDVNHVIMAIDMNNKGAIGCSYYVARDEKLYMLQDVNAGGEIIMDRRKFCLHLPVHPQYFTDAKQSKLTYNLLSFCFRALSAKRRLRILRIEHHSMVVRAFCFLA